MTQEEYKERLRHLHEQTEKRDSREMQVFLAVAGVAILTISIGAVVGLAHQSAAHTQSTQAVKGISTSAALQTPTPTATPLPSAPTSMGIQIVKDAKNNEVTDNNSPAKNYVAYIDISEADLQYINNNYTLIVKTYGNFPKTPNDNDQFTLLFQMKDPQTANIQANTFSLTVENYLGKYLFSVQGSNGRTYQSITGARNPLPGTYTVSGDTVTATIPASFVQQIIPLNPLRMIWKLQTQYENSSNDPQMSANNFLPTGQDAWIQYQ